MKQEFEMTEQELLELLDACTPVPYMIIGDYLPLSLQDRANNAWKSLAMKRGFKWDSVEPSPKGDHFFTATPQTEHSDEDMKMVPMISKTEALRSRGLL